MKKVIYGLVAAAMSLSLLVVLGAADADQLSAAADETAAVTDALIGAENVCLAMGNYQADVCSTAELSEEELQAQIDQYNALVDQYYTSDSEAHDGYQQQNEYLLREVFQNPTSYTVDGGVLSCDVKSISYDETGTSATISVTIVRYNKWIDVAEDGSYEITCCAGTDNLTTNLKKVDGVWKVQKHTEFTMGDDWTPAYGADSGQAAEQQAAALAATTYSSFDDAMAAANEIHVDEICPLVND